MEADLEAPPGLTSTTESDSAVFKVTHPEKFSLAIAGEHRAAPEVTVTRRCQPRLARSVPAISLASGRAIEVKRASGDTVRKVSSL